MNRMSACPLLFYGPQLLSFAVLVIIVYNNILYYNTASCLKTQSRLRHTFKAHHNAHCLQRWAARVWPECPKLMQVTLTEMSV